LKKAINQWCFPEGTPLEDVFGVSARAGFDAVELNVNEEGGIGLTPRTTPDEARHILKQASESGLQLLSVSTGLLWKYPLSSPDKMVRGQGAEIVRKQIELAAEIGADTVLVVPGLVTSEVSYHDCYARSQEELALLGAFARDAGVVIGVENVWNKFLLSPIEMKRYIDEISTPTVGVYFDVGNVLQFGYPEHWISVLREDIKKVHIKDFSTQVGNIHGFVPLLSGDVNWPAVVSGLRDIGYNDVITAEISPYPAAPHQSAMDIARQMDAILSM
jgi:L-ribulose-5-phosphate 3-epimerase